ncbi:MAG: CAP domain-containing protein [Candidatus Wildermuthbacteria bacterium]|nr:CAP domain-containing protein [Candidatus Wildermuthbacteria bacterium]
MKKLAFIIGLSGILGFAIFTFKENLQNLYAEAFKKLPAIENTINKSLSLELPKIIAPPPLRALQDAPDSTLTQEGVLNWTNTHRQKENLPGFTPNSKLNDAAAAKLQDMFNRQYFAHVSPQDIDAGDLAQSAGYEYLAIGENLALGNYKNDETLVQAWMNSPGHRANILHASFQEIGIAVGRGEFEGRTTWLAVQIFGKPLSICAKPNETLKRQIDTNQTLLSSMEPMLQAKKKEIERSWPKWGATYNNKVKEYNEFVYQYNTLLQETKTIVTKHNAEVEAFNLCVRQ